MALGWMYGITWVIGFGITMADIVIRQEEWRTKISWPRAIGLYAVSSLSYFFFYYVMHGFQFGQQVGVATPQDAITAANVLVNGLLTLYVFLILLMILFAVILSWQRMKRLQFWRSENWWLYPAVAVPIIILIWWKNFDVVKADIYLKEGERYRNASQWEHAIALHKAARDLDADEDFYYLMLALDYQLKAQDGNLDINTRAEAQATGEQTALEARRINPYNPDNTGNMGRYYFTLSQVTPSPEERQRRLEQTNEFFEKAVQLAPTNVVYHNLWAQTAYVEQDFDTSIERLKHSAEIDERYSPTWVLLGDSYAAKGDIDNALMAHTKGMQPNYGSRDGHGFPHFADHSIDLRMNYYISAGRLDDIIVSMQEVALQLPSDPLIPETIANALFRAGRAEEALPYYERSVTLRTAVKTQPSGAVLRNMGATYLNMSNFDGAEKNYKQVVDSNPNDAEARNALAYIYAQQKRYDEAIAQHQHILQQNPEDYSSLQNLSVLYNEMGRLREAIEFAQRALAVAPETEKPNWQQFIANLEAMLAQEETGL
jgi:tetratricopeptide (TPR) repeat protein